MQFLPDIRESFAIARRAVRSNPLRAGLTMLGIIGVFLALMGVFPATTRSMKTEVFYVDKWDWHGGDWRIMRNRLPIRKEYADSLKQRMTTAAAISISVTKWEQEVKFGVSSVNFINAIGIEADYVEVETMELEEGRFFTIPELSSARPVCVIGYEIQQKLFPNRSPIGEVIRVSGYPLEIIGIAKRVGGVFSVFTVDNSVIMPLRTLQTAIGEKSDDATIIAVKAASIDRKQDTKDELEFVMRSLRKIEPGAPLDFAINQVAR